MSFYFGADIIGNSIIYFDILSDHRFFYNY